MSGVFLQRIEWYGADNPTEQVLGFSPMSDIVSFTARKGTDVKNNILDITLKNPHGRYVNTSGGIRFKEEDVLKCYAKLTSDGADVEGVWHDSDNLIGTYYLEEFSQTSTAEKHQIKLTCVDRAYILFNKVFTNTYGVVSDDYWTSPGIMRSVVRINTPTENSEQFSGTDNDSGVKFNVDAKFVSEGGHITDYREDTSTTLNGAIDDEDTTITLTDATNFKGEGTIVIGSEHIYYSGKSSNDLTGCVRGIDNTVAASHSNGATVYLGFPVIDMTKIWKPLYEWMQELGTTQNTNYPDEDYVEGNTPFYDRAFLIWMDKDNKLHWLPATDDVDTTLEVGSDELYEVSLEKSVFDSVNMVIYNVGEDMYGAGAVWYFFNESSEVRQLKMRYQPMTNIIDDILNLEYKTNETEYPADAVGQSKRKFPTAYGFTPVFMEEANKWIVQIRGASAESDPTSDSEYNEYLRYAAMWRGRNQAISITSLLAGLRYRGRITRRFTHVNPGDLISITDSKTGLVSQKVRVIDVTHNGGIGQASTTMDVEEDEETITV
jgi:hypothetical protein